jgi:hypothetical protein
MNHLEYPIRKAQLLKGYEIKEQIRDKLIEEYISEYIKEQLDLITSNIIKKTISPNEYKIYIDITEKKRIDENNRFMNKIKETQKYIHNFIDLKSFNSSLESSIRQQMSKLDGNMYRTEISITQENYLDIKIIICDTLKTRFPDTTIQLDPILRNYIFIDWSSDN